MPLRFNRVEGRSLDQITNDFLTSKLLNLVRFFKKNNDRKISITDVRIAMTSITTRPDFAHY